MRHPFPRSRSRLAGVAGFALAWLLGATSMGQETSGNPAPLARYIPKDNVVFYVEYQGLDAHADAWKKSAAYKILNDTPTGVMLETLAVQLSDKMPGSGLSGAEIVDVIKHAARSGFLLALVESPEDAHKSSLVVVLRNGFKDKAIRPIVAKFLQNLGTRNVRHQPVIRAGHKVMTGSTTQGLSFTWWVEDSKKEDVVLAINKPEQVDIILETLDGGRPSAIDHPRRAELARSKDGFIPTGMAFLDLSAIKSPQSKKFTESESFKRFVEKSKRFVKDYEYLGIFNFKSLDISWGFQDEALMSVVRVTTSGPRQGLLALLDHPALDKTQLPPILPNVSGFTAASFDIAGFLDGLRTQARAWGPNSDEMVDRLVAVVKEKTKLRLKEDILAHFGPKVAWYIIPSKASATPSLPGAGMIGMMMAGAGVDQIPKLAVVLEIDDPTAFGKVLDELMATANREFKAQASAKLAGDAPATQPKGRNRGPSGPSYEFRLMSGPVKTYVLQVPPELSSQFPASLRPSIRVGPKHVVVAVSPDLARMVLETKTTWTPPSEIAGAFSVLPSKLKMLEILDPRDTLPGILASLPGKLQSSINTALLLKSGAAIPPPVPPSAPPSGGPGVPTVGGSAGAVDPSAPAGAQIAARQATGSGSAGPGPNTGPGGSGAPGAPGAANPSGGSSTFVFKIDADKLPSADSIKALLFPSIFTVEVNNDEIRITTREAFPTLPDPSKLGAISTVAPAMMGKSGLPLGVAPAPGGPTPPGGAPAPGLLPTPGTTSPGAGSAPTKAGRRGAGEGPG